MLGREGTRKDEGSKLLELPPGNRYMECIQSTKHQLKRGHIIRDAVDDGAALKVTSRKLNTTGNMHGHCDVFNNANDLKRMRDYLQLTDAIADIFHGDSEASAAKREK